MLTELRLFLTFVFFFFWIDFGMCIFPGLCVCVCVCVCGRGLVHTYHQVFKGFGSLKMIRPIRLLDESIFKENNISTFFMVFLHMHL